MLSAKSRALSEKSCPFYRVLAEGHPSFLSHVGYEFSLIGKDQSVEDPDRLKLALEEAATVIPAWDRVGLRTLKRMMKTANRFDRQVAVCDGAMGSDLVTIPWMTYCRAMSHRLP